MPEANKDPLADMSQADKDAIVRQHLAMQHGTGTGAGAPEMKKVTISNTSSQPRMVGGVLLAPGTTRHDVSLPASEVAYYGHEDRKDSVIKIAGQHVAGAAEDVERVREHIKQQAESDRQERVRADEDTKKATADAAAKTEADKRKR